MGRRDQACRQQDFFLLTFRKILHILHELFPPEIELPEHRKKKAFISLF